MLIDNSPPAVSADTHDHGGLEHGSNDASRVHTPIASSAAPPATPARPAGQPTRRAPAPTAESARRSAPRASETDTANHAPSPQEPPAAPRPADNPPAPSDSSASPITSATYRRRDRHTSGNSTCVARHAFSRQRPRRGRNRRTPSPVRTSRSRAQPQPPNTSHATARATQAAGRAIRLDHRTIVCDDEHDDLQRRQEAPRLTPPRFRRGASNNRITSILSLPAPSRRPHHNPR